MAGQTVNRIFANVGKAIAAFEAQLELRPPRFDRYVAAADRGDREAMRAAMRPRRWRASSCS
jgi:cytochrome c peroxidase